MKKILVLGIVFAIGTVPNIWSSGNFIERIEISGNNTISAKKIMKKISAQAGDIYSEELLLGDVKRIYEMEKFDNVTVDVSTGVKGVAVKFIVTEKPRFKKYKFVGNSIVSSGKLKEKLTLSSGDYFSVSAVMDEVRKMQDVYKEEGFSKAKITHFINEPDEKGKSVVTIYVEEGPKVNVQKINFPGVKEVKEKKIKNMIEIKEKKIFNPDKLEADVAKIKEFYRDSGFVRFDESKPYIYYDESGENVCITVFIYEDKKYKFGDISFSDTAVKKKEDLKKILKDSKIKKGSVYSAKNEKNFLDGIQTLYSDGGYLKVLIDPQYTYDGDKVDVCYDISEGPQVFINSIYLEGNRRTKDFVVRREIRVKNGDPFKLTEVRESQRRIFNLGFFSDVRILPTDTHTPDKMDLTFHVEEQQTGMLSMGAGYSSVDRLVGTFQVTESNFRGMGQKLSLMWEFGKRKKNYNLSFTEPYFFGRNVSFTSSIYDVDRVREYVSSSTVSDSYSEHKRGGSIGFGKRFGDKYQVNLSHSYEAVRLLNVNSAYMIEQQKLSRERGITSTTRISSTRDTRDYFWDPRTGSIHKLSEEVATGIFGGQNFFHRERAQASYFIPLVWRFVFVANFEVGAVHGYGSTPEVPIFEKFYIGGGESLRGYDYRGEVGPPEGGRFMSANNFEVKFPLVRENKMTVLQWAFFFDFGGLWYDQKDIEWSWGATQDNFKRGYGMGIRFKIPAFPVRLDWAKGLDHVKGESQTQWYFTIGDIFW